MNKKPLIGILPLYDPQKNSYWMLPNYLEALEHFGALTLILPPHMDEAAQMQALDLCDGILIPGGQDVEPELYGEKRSPRCGAPARCRDELEIPFFREAFRRDLPVLGVCRGLQLMNVALGGTLYQDLGEERPGSLEHDMTAPYDRVFHHIRLVEGSPLQTLLDVEEMGVNSYHHQSVKDIAPALSLMAEATDGVVESLYAPEKSFIWAVQWHPEYFWKGAQGKIFETFVEHCKKA